jgi:hypothetical protein
MLDAAKIHSRVEVNAIEAEAVIDRAIAQSALGHHMDDGLRERVRDIVGRINARGLVNRGNVAGAEFQLVGTLVSRLAFAETQSRYPDIARHKVRRPIVVIGYARTGSTIMHSLLGCDPKGYAPETWEVFYPSPPPAISPATVPARVRAADRDILELLGKLPALSFHPYFDRLGRTIVECDDLLGLDFHNGMVSRYALAPAAMLDTTMKDPEAGYRFHESVLQTLQWQRDFEHWVVKGTRHQSYLKELFEVYPDAVCVYTHRNPNETVGSVMAAAELFIKGYEGSCDRELLARHTPDGIAKIYNDVLDDPMMNDPRVLHIRFQDFMADHVETIRGIYEKAGLEFTSAFAAGIRDWLASPDNKSDRYGKFHYELSDYGVDAARLAPKFERYIERFELRAAC